ncbi:MBL fold metallo-hydrolase [Roseovarius nanhaiticus]|uniref:Glyoxylase, beta-lactamase superfamily II n=1 Tax=Roseovarius nanhaiticus TaxID=573024 RepID=A0A1N7HJZ7_9RHOB|nr:MBL fold metallo-hydrolase [Roseovarius nanhaiticus]SEL24421.1 Glyoxylase, beta-lactamase superfamily II [Roseovarius nanhaiticus]SIS25196.1 Glyoxylase, beta-lactamase superfamily II [Roseovarius nanhaiticus]
MMIDRRQVLAGLGGIGGLALCGAPRPALARTAVQMGSGEVVALSDGNLVLPFDFAFGDLPEDELDLILARYGVSGDQLEPPCNLTLLRQEDRIVLFDAGSGPAFMPSAGKLMSSLEAEGLTPDDITHVVFTHAHPDHLWGILDDFDEPIFANAEMMIGQDEWDYWTDPATVDTIGEARASFAVGAARRLAAIEGRVGFFKGGDEILPGIMAHATPGHTPGHMSFEIRNGGDAVMVGGDAISNGHVALARPDWPSGADQDPDLGAETRMRLLDQLVADDIALLGFHLPDGGLGRVERAGDYYQFTAEGM